MEGPCCLHGLERRKKKLYIYEPFVTGTVRNWGFWLGFQNCVTFLYFKQPTWGNSSLSGGQMFDSGSDTGSIVVEKHLMVLFRRYLQKSSLFPWTEILGMEWVLVPHVASCCDQCCCSFHLGCHSFSQGNKTPLLTPFIFSFLIVIMWKLQQIAAEAELRFEPNSRFSALNHALFLRQRVLPDISQCHFNFVMFAPFT